MKPASESVRFGSTAICYSISRSDRRQTVGITVQPDQTVRVVAPKGVRRTRIAQVVRGKAPWIIRCWDHNERVHHSQAKALASGETLRYLGRQYRLRIRRRPEGTCHASVGLYRGEFVVEVTMSNLGLTSRQPVRQALVTWYREHALRRIGDLAQRTAPKLGVTYVDIRMRELPKRWASTTSRGILYFNWRIIMARRQLVEYVVAHELCHLRHQNHSPAFWRMLGGFMPDYPEREAELERIGPLLDL